MQRPVWGNQSAGTYPGRDHKARDKLFHSFLIVHVVLCCGAAVGAGLDMEASGDTLDAVGKKINLRK
jgi:hypothetical protein